MGNSEVLTWKTLRGMEVYLVGTVDFYGSYAILEDIIGGSVSKLPHGNKIVHPLDLYLVNEILAANEFGPVIEQGSEVGTTLVEGIYNTMLKAVELKGLRKSKLSFILTVRGNFGVRFIEYTKKQLMELLEKEQSSDVLKDLTGFVLVLENGEKYHIELTQELSYVKDKYGNTMLDEFVESGMWFEEYMHSLLGDYQALLKNMYEMQYSR